MVKNIIQEIKIQRREHPVPAPKDPTPVLQKDTPFLPNYKKTNFRQSYNESKKKGLNKYVIWFGLVSLLGIIIFGISFWFSSAKINIVLKTKEMDLNKKEFTASQNTNSSLGFEIMIVSDELKKDLIFTEPKDVSLFAKGDVVLFNEFSTKPQDLLIHTKLSDNNGLIYLIDKTVTIPGYTLSKAKKIIAGSITIGITAQLAGDKYNGDPRDFFVVNFKNTTKYKKIYARSKTPLSGGVAGSMYLLGSEQIGKLNAEANSTFRVAMMKKLEAQVPSGYILYPNATTFSYNVGQATMSPTPESSTSIKGVLSAVIFKKDNLPKTIIKQIFPDIPDVELKEIEIPKLNSFSFNFSNPNQQITKEMKEVSFVLTGSDVIVWHPNTELLKSELLGINKKDAQSIFEKYPGIANGQLSLFPPWISYVPSDPSKIKIIVK